METYNAIIVGFGPTGAMLANLLGTMGMRVAVVEKDLAIFDKPRAITADHEALRAFQAVGLAEAIEAGTCPHPGTDFVGIDGQVIKRFYPMPTPGPLGWEPTFMFHQPTLEGVLRKGVERFEKVDVLLGHKLTNVRQDANSVEVDVETADGSSRTLRADYLLGCDGARSPVRSATQTPLYDLAFDEWWVVVDVQLLADIDLPERCVQYCRPSRPGTYIVGPDRLRRWEIKVMPGEDPASFNDAAYARNVLASFVDTNAVEIQRIAVYRFHAVVAERWRDGRIFLLGDAAHQMPPFLGQGMCAGLRDAYNFAWKLGAVMNGKAPDSLLDTYGQERRPHVQTVVEHAKSFGLIIGELDMAKAEERDKRLGAELAAGTAPTIRQSFIPGLKTGLIACLPDGQPRRGAGILFPQPWVSGQQVKRVRLDDIVRGDFYLVTTDDGLAALAVKKLGGIAPLSQARVVSLGKATADTNSIVVTEEIDLVHRWLEQYDARAALVRPDGFAFGVANTAAELNGLIDELAAVLAPKAEAVAC